MAVAKDKKLKLNHNKDPDKSTSMTETATNNWFPLAG